MVSPSYGRISVMKSINIRVYSLRIVLPSPPLPSPLLPSLSRFPHFVWIRMNTNGPFLCLLNYWTFYSTGTHVPYRWLVIGIRIPIHVVWSNFTSCNIPSGTQLWSINMHLVTESMWSRMYRHLANSEHNFKSTLIAFIAVSWFRTLNSPHMKFIYFWF